MMFLRVMKVHIYRFFCKTASIFIIIIQSFILIHIYFTDCLSLNHLFYVIFIVIITFISSILNYCFPKIVRLFYFHINSLCCESNNFVSSIPVAVILHTTPLSTTNTTFPFALSPILS